MTGPGPIESTAVGKNPAQLNERTHKLVLTGLMAALCYVAFTFLKIPVPTPGGGMVALHIGNAFCVLAALILGGWYGGIAGSLGMTIADLIDPVYVTSAPRWTFLASAAGLGFNVIADPVAGYIYKTYLLGIPQDVSKIMATWAAGVTAFNAAVGTLVVVAVYSALRPVLKRSGQFFRL